MRKPDSEIQIQRAGEIAEKIGSSRVDSVPDEVQSMAVLEGPDPDTTTLSNKELPVIETLQF